MAKKSKVTVPYDEGTVKSRVGQVSDKLFSYMDQKEITAYKLAKEINAFPANFYAVRDKKTLPSAETIIAIKQVLPDLNLNHLFGDDKELETGKEIQRLKDIILDLEKEKKKLKETVSDIMKRLDQVYERLDTRA
jgi:hypothetical protein